ncbi:HAD-IIA family hydrolase [Natronomonas halophila]|uniref:HAD-IIA family hydrolase n=1 Tax=Natronomonas halophila TaxID=2747817 RepID=UPI0015B516E2|nr:HAD-IIA family hydrolase [Natronomonas halophila]QLD87328.1 HAD-IIA family hydrolase [Natronomonas halophila]
MDYEAAVLDLDGTVYRGDELLPGAAAAIERLRADGVDLLFFSNNPTKSRAAYAERLEGLGVDVDESEVLSAGTVTTRFLADEHADDRIFVIGSEGLVEQFEAAGLSTVSDATTADVLVASYDIEFDYGDMLAGYRALEAGAAFYGTDPDLLVPAAEGMVPGSGAIINAVGGIVERTPEKILGKPSAEAQQAVLDSLGVDPKRCLVVGDRLNTDMALGERAGMTTVLVRTGVATDADVAERDIQPDYVIDSLAELETVLV